MIQHYLIVAFRNLLKYKTQNLISIIGLAVGLLCFSICFYCSRYMMSTDQCFDNYERLVDITLVNNETVLSGTSALLTEKLIKEHGHEAEAYSQVTYSRERPYNIYINDEKYLPYKLACMEVDSAFNRLFTPSIIAGTWNIASHTPNAVILTESAARKAFTFIKEAIGKRMVLTNRLWTSPDTTPQDGGITYTIQAVIKDIPSNISMNFMRPIDALVLNDSEGLFNMERKKDITASYTYALLRQGQTAKDLDERFRKANVTYPMFGRDYDVTASLIGENIQSATLNTVFSSITSIVGLLILLVALLNFFHFQVGSIINRRREFSIRKVLGNNMFQLTAMLFLQLLLAIGIALLLMLGLVEWLAPDMQISLFGMNMVIDKKVLMLQAGEYIILLLLVTFAICVSVALYIRRTSVQTIISNKRKRGGNFFRNVMLGIQFFICWLFVSMTIALYLQTEKTTSTLFNTLTKQEKSDILSLDLDYSFMKNEEKMALIDRFRQHAGVKDILISDIGYMNGVSGTGIQLEKDSEQWIEVNIMRINPNFISFMNIPLVTGRNIESGNDILVDNDFRDKNKKDILGTSLYNYQNSYTVCGIISSFNPSAYRDERPGYVFELSNFDDFIGHCYIKCYPGKTEEVRQWINQILKEVLPESVEPELSTFFDDINEEQAVETKLKDIILFFSVVSLIITLLGVYAAITLDTARRQKEVAIRKVNGAGGKQIIFLFARLYALLLVITAIFAFPVVYMVLQMWKEMYQIFFNDGILYWGGIFIGISLLTICTVVFKIWKIAHINPAEVIKNE
ncbi:ABC transporter permease [Bacteroides sp.]|uniref:ABC transporter permease n=1 Tax=Bacteroides sp. TaxID=29523 RepID=UPI00262D7169|nr:ABC transporter permease [Bacteroides sp.]MDD3038582.1 ABC transporter permease [Bacteroides sp.]